MHPQALILQILCEINDGGILHKNNISSINYLCSVDEGSLPPLIRYLIMHPSHPSNI